MLLKYAALGLLKLALVTILPAYVMGLVAGFLSERHRKRILIGQVAGFFVLIEGAVILEKGLPFFFGNIYSMVSDYPRIPVHLAIGLVADAIWVFWTWRKALSLANRIALRREKGTLSKTRELSGRAGN